MGETFGGGVTQLYNGFSCSLSSRLLLMATLRIRRTVFVILAIVAFATAL
jgi:hypothetical protein